MSAINDPATKKRLIYVKKLYIHAHEHIPMGTEFDRMIALHHFDNAVELLLKCTATKFNIPFKNHFVNFPDLWEAVNAKSSLSKKTEMFQLHDLRSDVQHWGVAPFSTEIIERFDVYVLDFINEVLTKVFNIKFDELFLASLVEDPTLKKLLIKSESMLEKGDYLNCMRYSDAAFTQALWQKEKEFRVTASSRESDFIHEMTDVLSIIALGIDYVKFYKHQKIDTRTTWNEEKQGIYYSQPFWVDSKLYSKENAMFSFNFALECILQWHF